MANSLTLSLELRAGCLQQWFSTKDVIYFHSWGIARTDADLLPAHYKSCGHPILGVPLLDLCVQALYFSVETRAQGT